MMSVNVVADRPDSFDSLTQAAKMSTDSVAAFLASGESRSGSTHSMSCENVSRLSQSPTGCDDPT